MTDFKRILFPVDFSKQSLLAAPYVRAFAQHFDAEVVLLHTEIVPLEPLAWQPHTDLLRNRLTEFADAQFTDLRREAFLAMGDPASEIVSYAIRKQADLIMMPTHGRGPFRRFVLGSVTTKVLHDTPCPVWTSAHLGEERPPAPPNLRTLVCAIDLDEFGAHTLTYADGLTGRLGARLVIAHAVPAVQTWPEEYLDRDFQADLIEGARKRLMEMQADNGATGTLCVGAGNIARFVAHAAQSHKADLVVIGRGGHGMLGRLRTHDYAVIRECACPVLSI